MQNVLNTNNTQTIVNKKFYKQYNILNTNENKQKKLIKNVENSFYTPMLKEEIKIFYDLNINNKKINKNNISKLIYLQKLKNNKINNYYYSFKNKKFTKNYVYGYYLLKLMELRLKKSI
jgi:hypothetical protein